MEKVTCGRCGHQFYKESWQTKSCPRCGHLARGEQTSSQPCLITTACIVAKALPDNSPELEALRAFRDEYVQKLPNGQQIISEYHTVSPRILVEIDRTENSGRTYQELYERLVARSLELIRMGKEDEALKNYVEIVNELRHRFLHTRET